MTEIPDAAIWAAIAEHARLLVDRPDPMVLPDETLFRRVLEAALPYLPDVQSEPPGVWKGTPGLLSRWEFHGTTYILVTLSADDDDNITLTYMPEAAWLKWSAKRQKKAEGQ
jgi:hypothetical protein